MQPGRPRSRRSALATPSPTSSEFRSVRTVEAPAASARLRIPAIGVDAAVEPVHRLPDGTIGVPQVWQEVAGTPRARAPASRGPRCCWAT